jgi:lipopolysaccharide export system permease protein
MPLIERYVFRNTLAAFVAVLACLTGVIWMTQALRQLDLVTTKGQTVWLFFGITALGLPLLVGIIAPIALFVATLYVLNKLNTDSEIVVVSAAGASPVRVLRPLLILALLVSVFVGLLSIQFVPYTLQVVRDQITRVHADLVTRILREGAFTTVNNGLTLHVRERTPSGTLLGIFVDDERDPAVHMTYIAEAGTIATEDERRVLILERGSVQRKDASGADTAIVVFDRYAFDLSELASAAEVTSYKPRERYTSELLAIDPADPTSAALKSGGYGRIRSELHDRLASPLYPVAFVVVAYAALGQARSSRQGRGLAALTATCLVLAIRIAGYGGINLAATVPAAIALVYGPPLIAIVLGLAYIFGLRPGRAGGARPVAVPA